MSADQTSGEQLVSLDERGAVAVITMLRPALTRAAKSQLAAAVHQAADNPQIRAIVLTGTGKVMRRRANRNHMFEHKSSRLTRRLYDEVIVAPSDVKEIKKLLGK